MNNYKNFSTEDFLQDEFFNEWVLNENAENTEIWERWLSENPEMREVVLDAKTIICAFDYKNQSISEEFYSKLKRKIDFTISREERKPIIRRLPSKKAKIAAGITGLVIAAGILFYSFTNKSYTTYSSNYSETKKVTLPDGSEVLLNANSSLKYLNSWSKNNREVWLKGEGFFKIKHIKNSGDIPVKLIVHASEINVEVVGTEFNVNTRDKNKPQVLLLKGKVRLSAMAANRQPINMLPGELALFSNNSKSFSTNNVNPLNYLAWTDHKYIFEKTSLQKLCEKIEEYYGKPFIIEDPKMRKQLLSGTLEFQNEDILLQTLSALLGAEIDKKNNQVIIYSKEK